MAGPGAPGHPWIHERGWRHHWWPGLLETLSKREKQASMKKQERKERRKKDQRLVFETKEKGKMFI